MKTEPELQVDTMQLADQKTLIFAWLDDLRTPGLKQTRGRLEDEDGNCCLGRLCRVYMQSHDDLVAVNRLVGGVEFVDPVGDRRSGSLPSNVKGAVRMWSESGGFKRHSLAAINDAGQTFPDIADIIEKNAESLFENGYEVAQWIRERKQ